MRYTITYLICALSTGCATAGSVDQVHPAPISAAEIAAALLEVSRGGMTKSEIEARVTGLASGTVSTYRNVRYVTTDGITLTDVDVRGNYERAPSFVLISLDPEPCLNLEEFAAQIGADERVADVPHPGEPEGSGSRGFRRQTDANGAVTIFATGAPYTCVTGMTSTVSKHRSP